MKTTDVQPSRLKSFTFYHLPTILFGCGILALSSIPYLSTPVLEFSISDKLAHFLEYAVFAALLVRSLVNRRRRYISNSALLQAGIFLTLFAVADEIILQRFIPGRSSDLYDLASDLSGAYLVLAAARIILWSRPEAAGQG